MGCLNSKPSPNQVEPTTSATQSSTRVNSSKNNNLFKKTPSNVITPVDDTNNNRGNNTQGTIDVASSIQNDTSSTSSGKGEKSRRRGSVTMYTPSERFRDTFFEYTKKQIGEHNMTHRKEMPLVPMAGKIVDLLAMYKKVRFGDLGLKNPYEDMSHYQFTEVKNNRSPYLNLVVVCKFLRVNNALLDSIRDECVVGTVVAMTPLERQEDFEESIQKTLSELDGYVKELYPDNVSTDIFRQEDDEGIHLCLFEDNCKRVQAQGYTFEHKAFEPVISKQDETAFPLAPWRRTVELRHYLWPSYYLIDWETRPKKSVEQRINELNQDLTDTIESIRERTDADEVNQWETKHHPWYSNFPAEMRKLRRDYQLHYWEVFLKCCTYQLENYTMLESRQPGEKGDMNLAVFTLPDYIQTSDDMRIFLIDYVPFDFELPADGYAWSHVTDLDVFKVDPEDVAKHFYDLVSSNRQWQMDTEVEGTVAWVELEEDVIKNDVATKQQKETINSRADRADLNDPVRMEKRRKKLLHYFTKKYEQPYKEPYINWAERLEEGFKLFEQLCKGTYTPVPRKSVSKQEEKENHQAYVLSLVKPVTAALLSKMKKKREEILTGFIQRHELDHDVFEAFIGWAERLEENNKQLQELCSKNQEVEFQIKSGNYKSNFPAIWVPSAVLDIGETIH